MTEKYPEEIIEVMEKYFPKGDKRRGEALALQAVAYVYGKKIGKSEAIQEVLEEAEIAERNMGIVMYKAVYDKTTEGVIRIWQEFKQKIQALNQSQKVTQTGNPTGVAHRQVPHLSDEVIPCRSIKKEQKR